MLIRSRVLYVVLWALLHWVPWWPRFEHYRVGVVAVRGVRLFGVLVLDM